jgi:hypothetical protein
MILDGLRENCDAVWVHIQWNEPCWIKLRFTINLYKEWDTVTVVLYPDPLPTAQAVTSKPIPQQIPANELVALHKKMDALSAQVAEIKQLCSRAASTPAGATPMKDDWVADHARVRGVKTIRIKGNRVIFDDEPFINLALKPDYPIITLLRRMWPKTLKVGSDTINGVCTPAAQCILAFLQDGIAELMSLDTLVICDQPIESIAAIAKLPDLVCLITVGCRQIRDMELLRGCKSLHQLEFEWPVSRPMPELPGVNLSPHLY